MNQLQETYKSLKAEYDAAMEMKNFNAVDELEDDLIDAEFALVEWSLDQCHKNGMKDEDVDFLRKNWVKKSDKIISMAMRLKL